MSQAPAWLFSFVDLAFLLLIAMTQVGGDPNAVTPVFGEVVVPRVDPGASSKLPSQADARWQVRVHPREAGDDPGPPYELFLPPEDGVAPPVASEAPRLSAEELRQELASLRAARTDRPLLSPDADSRSEDLLAAAVMLENAWPGRRRATVMPRLTP